MILELLYLLLLESRSHDFGRLGKTGGGNNIDSFCIPPHGFLVEMNHYGKGHFGGPVVCILEHFIHEILECLRKERICSSDQGLKNENTENGSNF